MVLAPVVAAVRLIVRGVLRLFGVKIEAGANILSVARRSSARCPSAIPRAWWRRNTATGCSARSTCERMVEEIMLHRSGSR
jgi:hypothetical protein